MFGFTIIRDGERAIVWDLKGRREVVDGPRRLFAAFRTVERLTRFMASPQEYLVVRFRDGRCVHRKGPVTEWFDPFLHREIEVRESIEIDANEAVVVYRDDKGEVTRTVLRGPALYIPEANEWLHEFSWHGTDRHSGGTKVPNALRFTKLWVIPDQMYVNVDEVRTTDEALLRVKLMVFFELTDIERMLDQTHDPIADIINALTADVIGFVGARTFEEFKEVTDDLNDLGTYPQLMGRAQNIGYRVNKVVYRGYHANDTLQAMHDNAIEVRTGLILDAETEKQAQDLQDLKLAREIERENQRHVQEERTAAHERTLKHLAHEQKLAQKEQEREQQVRFKKRFNRLAAEKQETANRQKLRLLEGMHALDADLTQVLVAENRNPDKYIMVGGEQEPQLHLHE